MKHYFYAFFMLFCAAEPLLAINHSDTIQISEEPESVEGQQEPNQPKTWSESVYENRCCVILGAGVLLIAAGLAYHYYASRALPISTTHLIAPEQTTDPVPTKIAAFAYPKNYGPESRALVDELLEMDPIFSEVCANSNPYAYRCDLAVTELGKVNKAGEKGYGALVLTIHADRAIESKFADPVDRLNARQELEDKIGAYFDKKFAPKVPVQETAATPSAHGDEMLKTDEMYPWFLAFPWE